MERSQYLEEGSKSERRVRSIDGVEERGKDIGRRERGNGNKIRKETGKDGKKTGKEG